jgi:hypothetical protein
MHVQVVVDELALSVRAMTLLANRVRESSAGQ